MKGNKMTKRQIEKEWKKIKFEIFENKPKLETPYLPDIVKRREFLLLAQTYLENIMAAKSRNDNWYENFETEIYNKVMKFYYNWGGIKDKKYI